MRAALVVLTLVMLLPGCLDGGGEATDDAIVEEALEVYELEWQGHVVLGPVDWFMHMQPTEPLLYDIQPAGFSMGIDDVPQAIEVRLEWEGAGAFHLHPHYVVEHDADTGGDTHYYGYWSDRLTESPACIRIPDADMAAGQWQMMIHPADNTMRDVDFTITVGVLGAEGRVLPEMHGHRADGDSHLEDHGWEPCQFMLETEPSEA